MKRIIVTFLCLSTLLIPVSASDLTSSTTIITPGLHNEPGGALIFTVNDNEFPDASANPVYIRLCLPQGVRLGNSLVGPLDDAINLGARLNSTGGALALAIVADAVQLVRYVQGEQCFYLKINQSTEQWVTPAAGGSLFGPNLDATVSFCIGINAANGAAYGFNNTDSVTTTTVPTLIKLDVSNFWIVADVRLVFTAYGNGTNLDPAAAPTAGSWPEPVLDAEDLLPIVVGDCPKIARTRWLGGNVFPFKR